MKKYFFIIFVLMLYAGLAQTENKNIQKSLVQAQRYFDLSKDSLLIHANRVINHALLPQNKALGYHYLGNTYKLNGNLSQALACYHAEKKIFKSLLKNNNTNEFKDHYANSIAAMGIVYSQQSNYIEALKHHFTAYQIFSETQNKQKLAAICNNIAIEYQSLHKPQTANRYFSKALQYNTNKQISEVLLYTNIAKNYVALNQLNKAKHYFDKALHLIGSEQNQSITGELYNQLGYYYYLNNHFIEAKNYLKKASEAFKDDLFGLSDTYYYYGLVYATEKNTSKALNEFNKALYIAYDMKINELIAHTEFELSKLYAKTNHFEEAYKHLQNYNSVQKKLLNDNNDKALALAQLKTSFQKHRLELKAANEKHKKTQYIYLFSGLGLLALLAFLFYRNQQKLIHKNILLEKDKAAYHQQALYLQMNPHFIFNCLGSISSFILQEENDTAITYLNHFARLMRLNLENSKEPLIDLDKEVETLTQYLELEKLRFNHLFAYTITVHPSAQGLQIVPMLLQPLVENAIIHGIIPKSDLGKISIVFETKRHFLQITLTDNGVGYDYSKQLKQQSVMLHKSMALEIVKNRIKILGGLFAIQQLNLNNHSIGTQIVISLPVNP